MMKLTSPAFEHESHIPQQYTCDGEELSPPLAISNIPSGTVSLVLIMDDPDVPKTIRPDGIWDHWIVFNISPSTTSIKEGSNPSGILGIGTGKNTGYQGPCPPKGQEHHYFFNLYALDTQLDLTEGATKKQVMDAMKDHVLAKAILIGRYERE